MTGVGSSSPRAVLGVLSPRSVRGVLGPRSRRGVLGGLIAALVFAGLADGAAARRFVGQTSQGQPISFRIRHRAVRMLDYFILDRCPGGALLRDHDSRFPPLAIRHGRFGGRFVDGNIATAVIMGRVRHGTVSGKLTDRVRDPKTHKMCHGRAGFRLSRR